MNPGPWPLRLRRLLVLLGLAQAVLSACAGNSTYACPGMPDKPLCLPPSAIYAITEGQGPPPASAHRPSTIKTGAHPCCGGDSGG